MDNLIAIQDRYVDRVYTARRRWEHRPDSGHAGRTRRAATRAALRELAALGFTELQARAAVSDAADMVTLQEVAARA